MNLGAIGTPGVGIFECTGSGGSTCDMYWAWSEGAVQKVIWVRWEEGDIEVRGQEPSQERPHTAAPPTRPPRERFLRENGISMRDCPTSLCVPRVHRKCLGTTSGCWADGWLALRHHPHHSVPLGWYMAPAGLQDLPWFGLLQS